MELHNFTSLQRQAMLDLALLAIYSDAHLALEEDERLQRLLTDLGLDSEGEREYELDTAIARIRRESDTAEHRLRLISRMAHQFPSQEAKQLVCRRLAVLLTSDRNVAPEENEFLSNVQEAMGL